MINFCSCTARGRTSTSGTPGANFTAIFAQWILLWTVVEVICPLEGPSKLGTPRGWFRKGSWVWLMLMVRWEPERAKMSAKPPIVASYQNVTTHIPLKLSIHAVTRWQYTSGALKSTSSRVSVADTKLKATTTMATMGKVQYTVDLIQRISNYVIELLFNIKLQTLWIAPWFVYNVDSATDVAGEADKDLTCVSFTCHISGPIYVIHR